MSDRARRGGIAIAAESAWDAASRLPIGLLRRRRRRAPRHLPAAVTGRVPIVWIERLSLPAALLAVGLVQGVNSTHAPAPFTDEGTYVSQAWAVQTKGALAPYTYWYDHPPLGWLMITLWNLVRGAVGHAAYSIDEARQLMLVSGVVGTALVYVLGRRLGLRRVFAAAAAALFGLSPLAVTYHRMVLLDNLAVPWALAAFVLVLSPTRRLVAYGGAGACFAIAVLSKETVLLLLPALVVAAVQRADARTRRYALALLLSLASLIVLAYPLYALLKGELLSGPGHVSLVHALATQLVLRRGSGSVFDTTSLAHSTVAGWLALDPWLAGVALVVTPVALVLRRLRAVAVAYALQVLVLLRTGYLPGMYVIAVIPFGALVVAGTADALWPRRAANGDAAGLWARTALARSRRLALAAGLVALALTAGPKWIGGDRSLMTSKPDRPYRDAAQWISRHLSPRKRFLVDDVMWTYLVGRGFDTGRVPGGFYVPNLVWYYKLDFDPAVGRRYPDAWHDFDYVVSSEDMRNSYYIVPRTDSVLHHSQLVIAFGRGAGRIEVRRVVS